MSTTQSIAHTLVTKDSGIACGGITGNQPATYWPWGLGAHIACVCILDSRLRGNDSVGAGMTVWVRE